MAEIKWRLIKKYPNRRLYDTELSCYITTEDVKQLVVDKIDIQIVDAKSGEDITLTILLQIILEEESLGKPIFTYQVLTQIIRFYGSTIQSFIGSYLEKNITLLMHLQQSLQEQGKTIYGEDFSNNLHNVNIFTQAQMLMVQEMMNHPLTKGSNLLIDMQHKWHNQTVQLFKQFDITKFTYPFMELFSPPENHTPPPKDSTQDEKKGK